MATEDGAFTEKMGYLHYFDVAKDECLRSLLLFPRNQNNLCCLDKVKYINKRTEIQVLKGGVLK